MPQNGVGQRVQPPDTGTPRTVVIGAGAMGRAVMEAFHRRMVERWGDLSNVACLAVVGESPGSEDPRPESQVQDDRRLSPVADGRWPTGAKSPQGNGSSISHQPIVSLPLNAESATRPEAREALRAAGPAVIAALVEALGRISRIGASRSVLGVQRSTSHEVACYVVAALDDPLGGGVFLDLAYLARHLISQRLGAPAGLTGLLLLPDALNPDDPRPALARAYAALRELDAAMSPTSDLQSPISNLQQGWGPVFDQGCYLLGALNAQGLGLEDPGERVELAGEALLQLVLTPLGATCESPLLHVTSLGARPQDYGALGLATWVYPAQALVETLARRLAGEVLSAWLGSEVTGDEGGKEAELDHTNLQSQISNLHPGPTDAAGTLLPAELLREVGLWRPLRPRLSLSRARHFRQDLEDEMAERLESLGTRRPELDRCAQALGRELGEKTFQAVAQRLDVAAPGRLPEAEAFVRGVEQYLDRLRVETEQAADAYWKDLERLEVQLERVGGEMDALAARFPEHNWRAVLGILRSPRRLISLILTYRDLARVGATYAALLARQMSVAMEVLQRDLVVETYAEALKEVQAQRTKVTDLAEAMRAARQLLAPTQTDLCGSLGFVLEQSVLTPESVEALYAWVRGHPSSGSPRLRSGQAGANPSASLTTGLLADVAQAQQALSAWLEEPDGEATLPQRGLERKSPLGIAAACLDYARRRCQVLDQLTVDDLLSGSLEDVQERAESLRGLVDLASPFLGWDETRLRGAELQVLHTSRTLGLGDGAASPLLEGLGEMPWAQVVATGEGQRVTALTVVRGLPLAGVAGLKEYAAAYHASDPASLHSDPDWGDLPDPAA